MNLQDAFYEQRFEIEFLRAHGDAFQTLFDRLMGLAYKSDFMSSRPWGNQGDRKNDGFLISERRLFQVYAPNEMNAAKATAKITEDFDGARVYWGTHFDRWTFVHNATDGLPPHVQKLLLTVAAGNTGIQVQPWCLEELRVIFRKLSVEDKETWFGPSPTDATKVRLGFANVRDVLERIAALPAPPPTDVKDVPTGKIEANALSEAVEQLLKEGMIKSSLVSEFLAQWHDETLGERLAGAFKAEYQRLREGHGPNQIFA
ncbi:MAG TPA: hypothetical protein PKA37_03335, partial [Planctomycetota bacterium]|nr:hypothetical protein [Planctomycetota bacterium]